jgi:hypothetical protein
MGKPSKESMDPFLKRHLRLKAQARLGFGNIRTGVWGVSRLLGKVVELGGSAQPLLDQGDHGLEGDGVKAPQIIHFVPLAKFQGLEHPFDDIVNVGVIPIRIPVTVNGDGFPPVDQRREFVNRHLWPLSRSIHCEKSEDRDVDPVEGVIRIAPELCRSFGGGVGGQGAISLIRLGEGPLSSGTVYRGGGPENKSPNAVPPAGLQELQRSPDVHLMIRERILDGGTNPWTSRQVDHDLEVFLAEKTVHKLGIPNIPFDKGETRMAGRLTEILPFESRTVVVVDVVET